MLQLTGLFVETAQGVLFSAYRHLVRQREAATQRQGQTETSGPQRTTLELRIQ